MDELTNLPTIKEQFLTEMQAVNSKQALEDMRLKMLGKKGLITQMLKSLGKLSKEERPAAGQEINAVRIAVEAELDKVRQTIARQETAQALKTEHLDVTLPGKKRGLGTLHPLTIVLDEIKELFIGMGFVIADGPEVETDYYNFEGLNIPANHPVKDEQDTFYVKSAAGACPNSGGNQNFVLRTQTSGVQVRVMEKTSPPVRIIAPGTVYRADDWDATHSPVFHQIEGLVVDEGITMGDLKGILTTFAQKILGENIRVRFRPSFFPFTEPSAEMDVLCYACHGVPSPSGEPCRVCKDTGWVELLGCGMVHPNVLRNCGIDPAKFSGYAFGMGLERIVMQRYTITDMRLLFENDIEFLRQF